MPNNGRLDPKVEIITVEYLRTSKNVNSHKEINPFVYRTSLLQAQTLPNARGWWKDLINHLINATLSVEQPLALLGSAKESFSHIYLKLLYFSLHRPRGRFSLVVTRSVCLSVPSCVIVDCAQEVRVSVFCHKKWCFIVDLEILNLEGHQNCMINSKVT